jgi:hypothetical protein
MATKAQSFRAQVQREAHRPDPKAAKAGARSRKAVPASALAEGHTAGRNVSKHAGRRGGAKLEDSANGKPSRKSTRGSADHTKPSNLQLRETRKVSSPQARATQGKARGRKSGASSTRQ